MALLRRRNLKHRSDGPHKIAAQQGLGQIGAVAAGDVFADLLRHHIGRDRDGGNGGQTACRFFGADVLERLQPVLHRHPDIDQQEIEGAAFVLRLLPGRDHFGPVGSADDGESGRGQHLVQDKEVGRVVIRDQHAPALHPVHFDHRSFGRRRVFIHLYRGQRERHADRRAFPEAAGKLHFAAHEVDQLAHDGEAEPGAAEAPHDGAFGLFETVEGAGDLFLCHADAGVRHLDRDGAVGFGGDDHPDVAVIGELDRVAEQVVEDLRQAMGIAQPGLDLAAAAEHLEIQPLFLGLDAIERLDPEDEVGNADRHAVEREFARLDLGHVEDGVEDRKKRFARLPDRCHHALLFGGGDHALQNLGHAQHAVQGGADLVAHVGEEDGFRAADLFGLLAGFLQPVGGGKAFGDVFHRADDGDRCAGLDDGRGVDGQDAALAIGPDDGAAQVAQGLPVAQDARDGMILDRDRAAIDGFEPAVFVIEAALRDFGLGQAEETTALGVGERDRAVAIDREHGDGDGLEDVGKLVALVGEVAADGFERLGRGEEAQLVVDAAAEAPERVDIVVRPVPRDVVDHAEGPDHLARVGKDGNAEIGHHPQKIDDRIARHAAVEAGVGDAQMGVLFEDQTAEGVVEGGLAGFGPRMRQAALAFEELPVAVEVDQRDEGDGRAHEARGQPGEVVEDVFGGCIQEGARRWRGERSGCQIQGV